MWARFTGILATLLLLHSCEHETNRLENYEVQGIDVSHYQSRIYWDSVISDGFSFAFVKATEGATVHDSLFCNNWDEMKRVGLRRGAYHFFRPRTSSLDQAENFMYWVELNPGDLPPVLDVEVLDEVSKAQLLAGVTSWLYQIELHYHVKPIIYTNLKFYNRYLAGHFPDYPIWIARYNWRQPVLANGRDWQFWQYGNKGSAAGIKGFVDFNVFKGSLEDLDSLCVPATAALSGK